MVTRAPRTPGNKRPPRGKGALSGTPMQQAEATLPEGPRRMDRRTIHAAPRSQTSAKSLPMAPKPRPQGSPGS